MSFEHWNYERTGHAAPTAVHKVFDRRDRRREVIGRILEVLLLAAVAAAMWAILK